MKKLLFFIIAMIIVNSCSVIPCHAAGGVTVVPGTDAEFETIQSNPNSFEVNSYPQIGGADVSITNPLPTKQYGDYLVEVSVDSNRPFTWANSALINTQKTYTYTQPTASLSLYEVCIENPSTVTDLTGKLFQVNTTLGDCYITSFSVPKSQTISGTSIGAYSKFVNYCFNGTNIKLVLSNDTALGGSDGFTAHASIIGVK